MQSLPEALAPLSAYRQFLLYKLVPRLDKPGKTDKLPMAVSGEIVDAHDSSQWVDAATACATATAWGAGYGVAFVFTSADPFWFLDVDDCFDSAACQWDATAQMLIARFPGAAVEVSQSGRGLHLFGVGAVPPGPRKKKGPGFDLYTEARFVALTGTHATGRADTDHSAALAQLVTDFLQADEHQTSASWTTEPRSDWRGPADDAELIQRAMRSRSTAAAFGGRASFAQLYNADEDALAASYPPDQGGHGYDASKADMALAQHLAWWTGADCERMRRIMESSALARGKWDDRPEYLENTIALAAGRQKDVYCEAGAAQPVPPPEQCAAAPAPEEDTTVARQVDGTAFMSLDEQLNLFRGCTYILDRDAILTPRGIMNQSRFNVMYGGWTFALSLDNQTVSRKAWACFTESLCMRYPKADSTCFRPELPTGEVVWSSVGAGTRKSRINTYRPIETLRIAGDPAPFLGLLAKMLPVERDRRALLTYLAACIQHKGVKFQWWPVLQGAPGNGKTLIISAMRHAIGEQYCFAPNVSDIAKSGNKFNSWIEDRLFVAMEEVYVADRRSFLEDFKTSITNDWLPIERKGIDQVMGDNRANGIMATNHRNGVPVDADQRRYCVFFTAQQRKADLVRDGMAGDYFPDLYDWAKGRGKYEHLGANYGYGVIHEYLANYPLDLEFNPAAGCQVAPVTSSSEAAIRESLGGIEQAVLEHIAQDRQGFKGGWVSSVALDKLLEDMRSAGRIPHSQRRELMRTLGYDWHPGLADGRVNNAILPDNAKPRLYVRPGSAEAAIVGASAIAKAYTDAQLTPPST